MPFCAILPVINLEYDSSSRPSHKPFFTYITMLFDEQKLSMPRSNLQTESKEELQAQVFKDDIYMISTKKNNARVIESDIVGENVVIHIISAILE